MTETKPRENNYAGKVGDKSKDGKAPYWKGSMPLNKLLEILHEHARDNGGEKTPFIITKIPDEYVDFNQTYPDGNVKKPNTHSFLVGSTIEQPEVVESKKDIGKKAIYY